MKKFAIIQRSFLTPQIGILHEDFYKFTNWHYTIEDFRAECSTQNVKFFDSVEKLKMA